VKGVALAHGLDATFMPKPYRDHAGSGTHLHVSLLDAHGRNIFAADDPAGSPALGQAIGGLVATINDTMARLRADRELLPPLPAGGVRAAQPELG
jgi:glutamine synthetase